MTGSGKSGSPLHLAISWPAGQVFCRDQGWARSKSLLAPPAGGFATQQLRLEDSLPLELAIVVVNGAPPPSEVFQHRVILVQ
jgi:hypothetical protein